MRSSKELICPCAVGAGGRRKRESLLSNVDPTQGWANTDQSGTGSSSTGPDAQTGTSAWRSSNTTDDNGWSAGPRQVAEDWGWGTDRKHSVGAKKGSDNAWQAYNGAGARTDDGLLGSETPSEAAAGGAIGEERDNAWDEVGPDIVELRPEEVVSQLQCTRY